jgi:short-subunit dehydrogenase
MNKITTDFCKTLNWNLIKIFIEACQNCKPRLNLSFIEMKVLYGNDINALSTIKSLKNKTRWRGIDLVIQGAGYGKTNYYYRQRGKKITSTYTLNTNIW